MKTSHLSIALAFHRWIFPCLFTVMWLITSHRTSYNFGHENITSVYSPCFPSLDISMTYFKLDSELANINYSCWQNAFCHGILYRNSVYIQIYINMYPQGHEQDYFQNIYSTSHDLYIWFWFPLFYCAYIISCFGLINSIPYSSWRLQCSPEGYG